MASDLVWSVLTALWAMLPAYAPNSVAVLVGGGPPIDGGRTWGDRRLLGDGKTWRGAVGGSLAGVVLALAMNSVRSAFRLPLPVFPLPAAVGLPVGAMVGDVAGSFVKRRTGRERGAPFPVVDQLGFVVGALGLALVLAPSWTVATFTPTVVLVVLLVTPLLHVATNGVAYLLGAKDEPW